MTKVNKNFHFENIETPFMVFQRSTGYSSIRFVDIFQETKIANPEKFVFFVSRKDPHGWASNWHQEGSGYLAEDLGLRFLTSEHHLMWCKAKIFGDEEIMAQILEAPNPAEAKKLGRQVSAFNENKWQVYRYRVLYHVLINKFSKSAKLAKLLIDTGDCFIVEAADYDTKFSIGLAEFSSEFNRGCKFRANGQFDVFPKHWMGENLLGIALMEVRSALKSRLN